jgi:arrestin-related trafficking adapter 3/6
MDGRSIGKVCLSVSFGRSACRPNPQRTGTYTFPISFEIPSHMPASLECDGGSITWKLVAKVRRPGVFTPNLTATRDVHVVSLPADADLDMAGEIQIERPWDDQLQYLFKVSRKTFAIGASFNIKVIFMPLAKVRMYKFAVDLEGKQLLCVA